MKIEHAAMYVQDLKNARDFFTRFLGGTSNEKYHNPKTGFQSYFITFDDGARLEIMTKPDLKATDPDIPAIGYPITNGPHTTGDGYYESVIASVEGFPIEITI